VSHNSIAAPACAFGAAGRERTITPLDAVDLVALLDAAMHSHGMHSFVGRGLR
jgi:hypothetical protein